METNWIKEFHRKVGINTSLDEFREILKSEGQKYTEIKDVKSFVIPAGEQGGYGNEIKYNDIATMIITEHAHWLPKQSGGASGVSGPYDEKNPIWASKYGIYTYNLTYDEMSEALKDCPGWGVTFRLTSTNLEFRSDHKSGWPTEIDILRDLARKKLDKMSKTKTYVYYINGVRFEYTSDVTRTLSEETESHNNSYFLYDKDGNYITSIGSHGVIYG